MLKRKAPEWIVEVFDDDTNELIVDARIVRARNGQDAGNIVHKWLELEGFDFCWRIEVEKYVD